VQEKISFCPPASALRASWESQPTIAHLQIAHANALPKFAKELFFLRSVKSLISLLKKMLRSTSVKPNYFVDLTFSVKKQYSNG